MTEAASAIDSRKLDMVESCSVELDEDVDSENKLDEIDPLAIDEQVDECKENNTTRSAELSGVQSNPSEGKLPKNSTHASDVVSLGLSTTSKGKDKSNEIECDYVNPEIPSLKPDLLGKTSLTDKDVRNNVRDLDQNVYPINNGTNPGKTEERRKSIVFRSNSTENKLSSFRKSSKSRTNSVENKEAEHKTKKSKRSSRDELCPELQLNSAVLSDNSGNLKSNVLESQIQDLTESKDRQFETFQAGAVENDAIFNKSPINLDELGMNDEDDYDESLAGLNPGPEIKTEDVKEEEGETSGSEKEMEQSNAAIKSSQKTSVHPGKRCPSEGSNSSESPSKKLCQEIQKHYPIHDAMLSEYMQHAINNIEDIQKQTDHLLSEIQTLRELAQAKEIEWNNILHLKKIKEEILLRLLRRKQVLSFERPSDGNSSSINDLNFNYYPKNFTIDRNDEISGLSMKHPLNQMNNSIPTSGIGSIPVSFPLQVPAQFVNIQHPLQRPILPKPGGFQKHQVLPTPNLNGRSSYNHQMGRQGPIKDVKSIIADYRQRHPQVVPRRGRRMKSILNPQMLNGPRAIAPNVDPKMTELGLLLTTLDAQSRECQNLGQQLPNGVSFKDVLIQFAALQHQQQQQHHSPLLMNGGARIGANAPHPPPPPYPEISLHPVEESHPPVSQPGLSSSTGSLLHGILTKTSAGERDPPKFTTFSPTLARLLTAPERAPPPSYLQSKNCGEITITPVQPGPSQPQQKNTEVVQLDEDDPDDPVDDGGDDTEESDRPLVIDESGNSGMTGNNGAGTSSGSSSSVPRCQGCRKRDAQFVCAGCANQWYCSRECQVTAWDEHSEHCSG